MTTVATETLERCEVSRMCRGPDEYEQAIRSRAGGDRQKLCDLVERMLEAIAESCPNAFAKSMLDFDEDTTIKMIAHYYASWGHDLMVDAMDQPTHEELVRRRKAAQAESEEADDEPDEAPAPAPGATDTKCPRTEALAAIMVGTNMLNTEPLIALATLVDEIADHS